MTGIWRFNTLLAAGLAATLSIKIFVAASVLRPTNEAIAYAAGDALASQGYEIAGLSNFSGRVALLAGLGDCMMYVIPISEQGWHQEVIRKVLADDQSLWFLFRGELYPNNQPRWPPLLGFYSSLALAYTGIGSGYEPIYAVVATKECHLEQINWQTFPAIPYRKEALLSEPEIEDF